MAKRDERGARRHAEQAKSALQVLVVRHAIAEDRDTYAKTGHPDGLRPLTDRGRRRMKTAAPALVRLVRRLDAVASSPLARAVETGEIIVKAFEEHQRSKDAKPRCKLRLVRLAALAPGKSAGAVLTWLADQPEGAVVALVGHEPDLSQFVSWALTGLRESFLPLKKGAACLLEFSGEVKPAHATLLWAMKPSHLRMLANH